MKIKISELKGATLDWAARKASPLVYSLVTTDTDMARCEDALRNIATIYTGGEWVEVPDELVSHQFDNIE